MSRYGTPYERFISKVQVGQPDECWPWLGMRDSLGYGRAKFGEGISRLAHRFSYTTFVGPIPDGLKVLHRCDNPSCVNPNHLRVGTDLDNVHDRDAKGRAIHQPGEGNGRAVLTAKQVTDIRRKYASGRYILKQLSGEYGVSLNQIHMIVRRKNWKHVP